MVAAPRRTGVNVFLACFLLVLVIDGFRPVNGIHARAAAKLDTLLDVTGLWQGPWRLYGPVVKKDNLRLSADVVFADGTMIKWQAPDWTKVSPLWKFVHAREMNYYGNILVGGQEPAWDGLAAHLARVAPGKAGKTVPVESVTLRLSGALIPDPDSGPLVPARPYVAFDEPQPIYTWTAPR